ncbi:armadillo/beta-catenin/plakoglobin [Lentinula detonsa]|uniref:Armadillo/beta-catenin/plakoglobin n=1 Tax=Lentinula detonsa TaxID=2804962 RepID=A0A9W8P0A7_9AGAR|nr:armadillo/beta-catenin/plakoglobin [Lentinula detonsa]
MSQLLLRKELDESQRASVPLKAQKNTLLISHGRPPWYGPDGKCISDAFVIGVGGGSASGKVVANSKILSNVYSVGSSDSCCAANSESLGLDSDGPYPLTSQRTLSLSFDWIVTGFTIQDSFYKYHSPKEIELAFESKFDFDHPDAIDMPMFASCLADLKACRQTNIPVYSFAEHQRLQETKYAYGATVIIGPSFSPVDSSISNDQSTAEGIMALHDPALRSLYDLKVFVQCDSDLMLARRITRDVKERGRSLEGILEQYLRYVKPSYDNFVRPTAAFADIIVPGQNNSVAIELISTHTRRQLQERSNSFRPKMVTSSLHAPSLVNEPLENDPNLMILPSTPQLEGIFTILRSKDTNNQDFIFFTDRLSTLLVEHALQFLPYAPLTVTTPLGVKSHGKKLISKYLCGVSILRSGSALERGFRRVINNVPVGTLLIQSNSMDGEPLLLHLKLPVSVRHRSSAEETWVILLDAQIGTGAAAFMSIRILLEHGVKQDHIIFVTFLVARTGGITTLRRAFPHVRIVCGTVDNEMREGWLEGDRGEGNEDGVGRKIWVMNPGMGQIGDRYYL